MIPVFRVRHTHRGLSVVLGVQLLFWILSGIYFAWTNIHSIRGEDLGAEPTPIAVTGDWISPTQVYPLGNIKTLTVISLGGMPYYRIQPAEGELILANAITGDRRGELSQEEAIALARQSLIPEAEVVGVAYLTSAEVGPHHEYREHPLPVWQVEFDHPSHLRVYVSARAASVETFRNRSWRIFDFLWMMHTMDYLGRDNINNPLLRVFSLLALSVVVSGFALWAMTQRRSGR